MIFAPFQVQKVIDASANYSEAPQWSNICGVSCDPSLGNAQLNNSAKHPDGSEFFHVPVPIQNDNVIGLQESVSHRLSQCSL